MTSSAALLAAGLSDPTDMRAALLRRIDQATVLLTDALAAGRPLHRGDMTQIQNVLRDGRAVIAYGKPAPSVG